MTNRRRVLIVEDESLIAMLLEEMIKDLGYEVSGTAHSLLLAHAAAHSSYDMAILDVKLQGQDIYPFADELAARGVPFAFATGNGGASIPNKHAGAPVLQKPFMQEALKRVLDTMPK
ncbi:MAG: response regulator [Rhizomicrobium sp.]|jgi:CheY-like chemotaxis protein